MIPRYARPDMAQIWTEANKYKIWFDIQSHACDAQAELGVIPKGAAKTIRTKGPKKFTAADVQKILTIEKTVKHDVIAFLTHVGRKIGKDARFLHQGMTSSDMLDTALSVQLTQAADILIQDVKDLLKAVKKKAITHKKTICVGRSHGIHAEPTTFGLKLAGFYAAFDRNLTRLQKAKEEISTCALSGAVGTFANIDPRVEKHVAKKLGLTVEPVSTQVIPRDRHAAFFATLGLIASSIEHLATEIRHLQRTEVREVEEFFSKGQKGSSAMPHKRNPILTENLTGLARMVRSAVIPAMENVALWHERDISHSSVERMIAPDATITLDFALARLTNVIENLLVYPDTMEKNLCQLNGLVFSQQVLLALTQAGVSREDAYQAVQRNAMKVWDRGGDFLSYLKKDAIVTNHLKPQALEKLFDLKYHTKNVDKIFKRVFK